LVVALLVIAFLVGRESGRSPTPGATLTAPQVLEPEASGPNAEQRRWPTWADLDPWEDADDPELHAEPLEQRPDGTLLLSNRGNVADTRRGPNDATPTSTGSAVTDYFLSLDMIQSETGAGDPNAFAMGLIKAGVGGSTAGFDQLIADTQRMEQEIRTLTPPPSCEGYHEANLKALHDSREILEEMKRAFKRRDFSRLSTIAKEAGTLQSKANELRTMRERIVADASR
jgi:hypothetical protein